MSINSSGTINDELLTRFKNAGPNFVFISFGGTKFALAIIAQVFCASLIWVTLKSKNLHETFNILILANAICCFFYMFTFAIQFFIAANGTNFIPLRQCFPLMILPIFCAQCQYLLFLALALDRLMTALFPVWHMTNIQRSTENTRLYLLGLFMAIFMYSTWTVSTGVNYALADNAQKLVTCSTPDAVPTYIFQVPVYFNFLSLCAYMLLFMIMRKKKSTSDNFRATRKILKSILSAFLLEFLGWFSNTLIRNVLIWTRVGQMSQWYVMNVAGLFLIPSLAMFPAVLYTMSTEYGRAFRHCFGFYFPFSKTSIDLVSSNAAAFVVCDLKTRHIHTIALSAKHVQMRQAFSSRIYPRTP